jgi:hypothetical protein
MSVHAQGEEETMILRKWWNNGKNPFAESCNLIALSILLVASFLTMDSNLFRIGVAVEVIYLILASLPFRYRDKRCVALELSFQRGEYGLDRLLLVVTVAGFVLILFFGFGKHLLNNRWSNLSHSEGWEAGAIMWTGLFLIYYVFKFKATGKFSDKFIIILISCCGTLLLIRAWNTMGQPRGHILAVLGIGACLFTIDLINAIFHEIPRERMRSRESLFWADIPIMAAVVVLGIYLWAHPDTENPDVFVSGVISCQLLMSNAFFIVTEFGWLESFRGGGQAESPNPAAPTRPRVISSSASDSKAA